MCFDKDSDCDELGAYKKEMFTAEMEADIKLMNEEIRFWVRTKNKYSFFHVVTLWLLAAPVSSMSSEGDFSFINRLLTTD